MKLFFIILLTIGLIFESSITTIPLTIPLLVVATVIFRDYTVFLLAFIFGILLDIILFKTVGLTSLFLVLLVFLILAYEKKFEINTKYFIALSTFLSSFFFLILSQRGNVILQSAISIAVAITLFEIIKKVSFKRKENG